VSKRGDSPSFLFLTPSSSEEGVHPEGFSLKGTQACPLAFAEALAQAGRTRLWQAGGWGRHYHTGALTYTDYRCFTGADYHGIIKPFVFIIPYSGSRTNYRSVINRNNIAEVGMKVVAISGSPGLHGNTNYLID